MKQMTVVRKVAVTSVLTLVLTAVSCGHGNTSAEGETTDTLQMEDSLDEDTTEFLVELDDGLSLGEREIEVFGDFIFAFTHNGRFQAERIRFPLHVVELDGSEDAIRSGKRFRSEFQLPGNDYYTLILGNRNQMDVFQNDSMLTHVALQILSTEDMTSLNYNFRRTDGRWYLESRTHTHINPQIVDFMHFYHQFVTDTVFQQDRLAQQVALTMDDPEDGEEGIEGTIDRDQWPVFRPEMPSGQFVNIDFGQVIAHPHRILLLKCGISNSMMDIFTFQQNEGQWKLTSYEN